MSFLFGLLIGMAVSSSGSTLPQLSTIPFRCFAALDISEAEYRDCRRSSLRAELYSNSNCRWSEIDGDGPCSFTRNVAWEISALHELKKAAEAKAARP